MKCKYCGETKELERFTKDTRYKSGFRSKCKDCHTAYIMDYYRRNPDKAEEKRKLNRGRYDHGRTVKRHGLTQEQYDEMFKRHDGKCWICLTADAKVIDHDHDCCKKEYSCGKCVRGLLCSHCNRGLGMFRDETSNLFRAITYLTNPV